MDKDDPSYIGIVRGITVTLDGVEVKDCIMADEELGKCAIFSRTIDGNLVIVQGEVQRELLRGNVEIKLSPDAAEYINAVRRTINELL